MSGDRLTVQSITGVELSLRLAGPGMRSYAFIIDWHIRLLIASAWLLASHYLFGIALTMKSQSALFASMPAAAIYFLYHPILEVAMLGRTPGKRTAGVRIVGRDGGPPTVAALLIRNVFRLIDSLPAAYLIGLSTCFLTAQRVRFGDMAAGTLLVLDGSAAEQSLLRIETLATRSRSQLRLDAIELIDQVLERWTALEPGNRVQIARSLIGRIEANADPAMVQNLDEAQLHARLQSYLAASA